MKKKQTATAKATATSPKSQTSMQQARQYLHETLEVIFQEIRTYESDTFSADSSELREHEVLLLASKSIASRVAIGDNVDGISLSVYLDEIRQEKRRKAGR